ARADAVHGEARDGLGRAGGALQRDGQAALEVEAEQRLQSGGEPDQRGHHEHADEQDREPQSSGLQSSVTPFAVILNWQSRRSAARRHITIRCRNISKYSMTWLISVSMVNSSVTVRAPESTRRKDCLAA